MGGSIDAISKSIATEQRAIRRAEDALQTGGAEMSALPEMLRAACESTQLARGTLTIKARHAAGSHAIAAWLRSGGEAALCRAVAGVKRVKVRVG